ncbi:hypothetical protein C1J01_19745 [Nonomuraea aridisoli]|uniref:Uncharacterized protein n=1 Tax=Nonomuraea aridisoli TaxID=2070368 RepID=A0A2W2EIX5_9ACTN|nr:hypothetical protein C1J01_19745 [Nonomuraea aridisoli]
MTAPLPEGKGIPGSRCLLPQRVGRSYAISTSRVGRPRQAEPGLHTWPAAQAESARRSLDSEIVHRLETDRESAEADDASP